MIEIGVLGATGLVGRHLALELQKHPFIRIKYFIGSELSIGKKYKDVWIKKENKLCAHYPNLWKNPLPFPNTLDSVIIHSLDEFLNSDCNYIISTVSAANGYLEDMILEQGKTVISISPYKRCSDESCLGVINVNNSKIQSYTGKLYKSPNCVVCGSSIALAALEKTYGLTEISVTTFQSLSGRGDALYDTDRVLNEVYPLRTLPETTEENIREELAFLFKAKTSVSAYRVSVQRGHLIDIRCKLKRKPSTIEEVEAVFKNYNPIKDEGVALNSIKDSPAIIVQNCPQPRNFVTMDENGVSILVGNVKLDDDIWDINMTVCVDNVTKGAWQSAVSIIEYINNRN